MEVQDRVERGSEKEQDVVELPQDDQDAGSSNVRDVREGQVVEQMVAAETVDQILAEQAIEEPGQMVVQE